MLHFPLFVVRYRSRRLDYSNITDSLQTSYSKAPIGAVASFALRQREIFDKSRELMARHSTSWHGTARYLMEGKVALKWDGTVPHGTV